MKYINLKTDLGKKETFEKWNGKFPDETSYDQVIRVTEVYCNYETCCIS